MPYEQKPGTGSIWKNENKSEDFHGDFKGTFVDLDGNHYFVDAWKRGPNDNPSGPALRFRVKPKQPRPQQRNVAQEGSEAALEGVNDEIPF